MSSRFHKNPKTKATKIKYSDIPTFSEIKDVNTSLSDKNRDENELAEKEKKLKQEIEDVEKKLKILKETYLSQKRLHNDKKAILQQSIDALKEKYTRNLEYETFDKNKQILIEMESVKSQIEEVKQMNQQFQNDINEVQKHVDQYQMVIDLVPSSNSEVIALARKQVQKTYDFNLYQQRIRTEEAKNDLQQLSDHKKTLEEFCAQVEYENDYYKRKIEELKSESSQLRESRNKLQETINGYFNGVTFSLVENMKKTFNKETRSLMKKKKSVFKNEKSRLMNEIQELKLEYEDMVQECQKLQKQNEDYIQQIDDLKSEINSQKNKLNDDHMKRMKDIGARFTK